MKSYLYTIQRCTKDSDAVNRTLLGKVHASNNANETLCGLKINDRWWILTNEYNGKATCPRCLKIVTA